jgi:hypothetical protein
MPPAATAARMHIRILDILLTDGCDPIYFCAQKFALVVTLTTALRMKMIDAVSGSILSGLF